MKVVEQVDEVLYEAIAARRADPMTQLATTCSRSCSEATPRGWVGAERCEIRDELLTMIMAGLRDHDQRAGLGLGAAAAGPRKLERLRAGARDGATRRVSGGGRQGDPALPAGRTRRRPQLGSPPSSPGYPMPEGTTLMVSIYLVHSDPEAYPEPESSGRSASSTGDPRGGGLDPVRRRRPALPRGEVRPASR